MDSQDSRADKNNGRKMTKAAGEATWRNGERWKVESWEGQGESEGNNNGCEEQIQGKARACNL